MAERILINSKCQRPGVCNAAETLLVHRESRPRVPAAGRARACANEVSSCAACERSRALVPDARPATDDDFRTEYLDLILSVKVVDTLSEAIDHIEAYGSHHTDVIVTNDLAAAESSRPGSTRRPSW